MQFPVIKTWPTRVRRSRTTSGRSTRLPSLGIALLLAAGAPTLTGAAPTAPDQPLVDHRLEVKIEPDEGRLQVTDQMRLPEGKSDWALILHSGLDPEVEQGPAELTHVQDQGHLSGYRLHLTGPGPVTLSYGGRIEHAFSRIEEGMGRAREWSPGVIREDGVFLDGNSGWYPRIPDTLQTFQLTAELPEGWTAVSQGAGPGEVGSGHSTWTAPHPQDDIYLIAGRYQVYRSDAEGPEAQVYLRAPDPELADRYLKATHRYIDHYSKLIAPYPFAKFALVENFWDTGYGMPSFTLLGPSVIRLPFIIHTSYPHEILHNWWGNSVFVDERGGNWCEGLTSYMADYWVKEQAGKGVEARRDMLKSYADYVRNGKDFPLADFHGRHDLASQDIGYDKAAMVFHMLRRRLDDPLFQAGLKTFYADNQFRKASWDDLRAAFEKVSGRELGDYFRAWVNQPGAPRLALEDIQVDRAEQSYRVTGRIRQTQPGPSFPLRIPVVVTPASGEPIRLYADSQGKDAAFSTELDSQPVRISVDPDFDLFRTLLPGETPVTFSNLFGSDAGLILLPSDAPKALGKDYARLASAWQSGHPHWQVKEDDEIQALPTDRPVWILGWENRQLATFAKDAPHVEIQISRRRVRLNGQEVDAANEGLALTRDRDGRALAWLATTDSSQLDALARKLPHYGKYSYLVFSGTDSTNRIKGQWPSGDSELVRRLVSH